jgi:allene oxide cyclase
MQILEYGTNEKRALSRRLAITVGASMLIAASMGSRLACAGESLHLVEHETTNTTIHANKGKPDSMGDEIVFANPVFDSGNSHEVGVLQGNCVRVIVGKSWECFFTLVLANDRITLEGPYADSGESVFAITGGTGKYVGAKGQMTARSRDTKPGSAATTDLIYDIR